MSESIRDKVQQRYAEAARAADGCCGSGASCCAPTAVNLGDLAPEGVFGSSLYTDGSGAEAPEGALAASLGCGVPTAVADLHEGETLLDLGSGAGADVLISARRVGPTGRAIGLDMTPEMLDLARRNAAEAGVDNVEFLQGYLEEVPLPDESVDVIISNCVINLAADKDVVLREAFRVLRPGGRLAVSDVIALADWGDEFRAEVEQWTGCISGALQESEYRDKLEAAGFVDVEIEHTHQVHELAVAAVVRARRP